MNRYHKYVKSVSDAYDALCREGAIDDIMPRKEFEKEVDFLGLLYIR
ncbi:hypothetical protein JXB31_01625 [Candidatus Woesearchaeota archaeon]|nr:hypothetical protein [Candidatus Woesearchaeota archaeon]